MRTSKKRLFNYALIIITLIVVLVVGFNGNELSGMKRAFVSIKPIWIVVCFALFSIYVILDALCIHRFLRSQKHDVSFMSILYTSVIGVFYCNLTPGSSGGQPMQIYYLTKRNIPVGIGTSALTIKFFCFQVMLILFGAIAWMVFSDYIMLAIGGGVWILIMGYIINFVSIVLIVLFTVKHELIHAMISFIIKILTKLRLIKRPEITVARWEGYLVSFRSSITLLLKKPSELIYQLVASSAQIIVWGLIPAAVYYALGHSGSSVFELITIAIMIYISASYAPLPGGSGAQEGVFTLYYSLVFKPDSLFIALLIWRFFTFYLSLILGSILIFIPSFRLKRRSPKSP